MYLDEVSVVSLLSSRLGKIPSQYTHTLTRGSTSEVNSAIEGNATVVKAKVGSRLESTETEDTQVVSKATIQATFKEFYDSENTSFALRPIPPSDVVPTFNEVRASVEARRNEGSLTQWLMPVDRLSRGQIIELEVDLSADSLFRMSTIISTISDIVSETADAQDSAVQGGIDTAMGINKILEKLMAGLIPLYSRASDYFVISDEKGRYLIHRRLLESIQPDERPSTSELHLACVTQKSLFWKDIRRLLFSNARFRILCRLNHDGLASNWSPIKMDDIIGEVVPEFKAQISMFGAQGLDAMSRSVAKQSRFIEPRLRVISDFGEMLAQELEYELTANDREHIQNIAESSADLITSVPSSRAVFADVKKYIVDRSHGEVDAVAISRLRMQAFRQNGIPIGGSASLTGLEVSPEILADSKGPVIDAEVIAIYW